MPPQSHEPRRGTGSTALLRFQRARVGQLMQGIELMAVAHFFLHEAATIPGRAFEQDGQVLAGVPIEELGARGRRHPDVDLEQMASAFRADPAAAEQLRHRGDGRIIDLAIPVEDGEACLAADRGEHLHVPCAALSRQRR
jgi:hypothetical protein